MSAFARAALVLSALAGCSGNVKDKGKPAASSGGEPNAAGGAGETAAAGSDASSAGGGDGSSAGDTTGAGAPPDLGGAGGAAPEISAAPAYASSVESFEAGEGAGFNQPKLPDIVLGPPQGIDARTPSLDVVSLGAGGEIVLGFGELGIVDQPGPDLIVFENPFWPGGDATQVFAELGEVSVSEDGETWQTFPCDTTGDGSGNFKGCAGVTPTLAYDAATLIPLDPKQSGGDAFDLADLGVKRARFVKIHDLETQPRGGITTGFDLDAVAAIHAQ
jgi:hypothetical protein